SGHSYQWVLSLKSKAIELHCDSITQDPKEHIHDGKVLFKPYEGASPRLYRRSFAKEYEVKDPKTGDFLENKIKVNNTLKPSKKTIDEFQKNISEKFSKSIVKNN
uniref:hypothetical protein n=1 Tax=Komagataeibacter xylinus TaxID=28448 RepID=UPI00195543A9